MFSSLCYASHSWNSETKKKNKLRVLGKREGVVQISIHWLGLMQHWEKEREEVVRGGGQPPKKKEKKKKRGSGVHGQKKKKKKKR